MLMNRNVVLATALVFAALVLPNAHAQAPTQFPATVFMKIHPIDHALAENDTGILRVEVGYCYFFLGGIAPSPTAAHLNVAEAPGWLVTTLSPSTIYFPVYPQPSVGMQDCDATQSVNLVVKLAALAPSDSSAAVKVTVVADPNSDLIAGSAADDQTLISTASTGDHAKCPANETAPAENGDVTAAPPASTTVESASVAPVSGTDALVGALALGGAGMGVVARRRLR
ncbi:MAG: hypothetical protein ACYDCK_12390 [Thermoplasmatota archaeon]